MKQLWQKWKQHLEEDCVDEVEELIWDCIKAGFLSDEEIAEECEMYIEEEYFEEEDEIEQKEWEQIVGEFRKEWEMNISEFINSQHNYQNLETAFLEMETRGIVTAHYAGFTDDDGFDEVNEEATERHENGETLIGCCFYTRQDLEHTFHDHPQKLYLCFGNYFDRLTIEEVGTMIIEELEKVSFTTEWNGSGDKKIAITNLYWDKVYR